MTCPHCHGKNTTQHRVILGVHDNGKSERVGWVDYCRDCKKGFNQ
jgi:hypothetical protein